MPRPIKAHYRDTPTVWLDYKSGTGVTDAGHTVTPRISGRRKTPSLADLLDTAHAHQAGRIMLCGDTPPQPKPRGTHWLITPTPGWVPGTHWLKDPPVGRFTLDANTARPPKVEIHTCRAWFGTDNLTPAQALDTWRALTHVLGNVSRGRCKPLLSPARTAMDLWAASLPDGLEVGIQEPDVAAVIHATSGQHHIEHLAGEGNCQCGQCRPLATADKIGQVAYIDGRFMYAALGKDLGCDTARMMTMSEAADLWRENPYARARYHVRVTVPDTWEHVGILGQQLDTGEGWHYPNVPGARFDTWADSAEVHLAASHGWDVHVLEGIDYGPKSRCLNAWSDRLVRGRTETTTCHPEPLVQQLVAGALRAILITGIGQFASRGRDTTRVASDPKTIPAEAAPTAVRHGDVWAYDVPGGIPEGGHRVTYQPGIASQIWGRARTRVLQAKANGQRTGVLALPPSSVIGIQGDAVYTSVLPTWCLPTARGGADDGKPGRLRLKGYLDGPLATPATVGERNALRRKAVAAGVDVPLDAQTWEPTP